LLWTHNLGLRVRRSAGRQIQMKVKLATMPSVVILTHHHCRQHQE
jgi:hypothetical protein